MYVNKETEDNLWGLIGELLIEGHGDKINFISNWYLTYSNSLSYQALKMILVRQGFLPNPLEDMKQMDIRKIGR